MSAGVIYSELLKNHGFVHGFSTREGGVSEGAFASLNLADNVGDDAASVIENRKRFAQTLGTTAEQILEVTQVHGKRVYVVTGQEQAAQMRTFEADALVNQVDGRALAVRTADCVPILLAHPGSRTVAAAHAGWRGAAAGVILETLRVWNVPGDEVVAAIGPHIRKANFEVGADVAEQIAGAARGMKIAYQEGERLYADLSALVRQQLLQAGVRGQSIDDVGGDTFENAELFFSHRRDRGTTGRHWAVISPQHPRHASR